MVLKLTCPSPSLSPSSYILACPLCFWWIGSNQTLLVCNRTRNSTIFPYHALGACPKNAFLSLHTDFGGSWFSNPRGWYIDMYRSSSTLQNAFLPSNQAVLREVERGLVTLHGTATSHFHAELTHHKNYTTSLGIPASRFWITSKLMITYLSRA